LFTPVKEEPIDTHSKALRINLDPRWYGTFAEIGGSFGSAAQPERSRRAYRLMT